MAASHSNNKQCSPGLWHDFSEKDIESVRDVVGREKEEFIIACFAVLSETKGRDRVEDIIERIINGLDENSIMERYQKSKEENKKASEFLTSV